MLRSIRDLFKYSIEAYDGHIGHVHDLFFDDCTWSVRYIVADVGSWLAGRQVLLAPLCITDEEWNHHKIHVSLTKEQVKDSPDVEMDKPISRQYEERLYTYYGWPVFWGAMGVMITSPPVINPESVKDSAGVEKKSDPCLRSIREVTGYTLENDCGEAGHIEDFIADDKLWNVRYIVVNLGKLKNGKKVLISPEWAEKTDWIEKKVFVNIKRDLIDESPEYKPDDPVNRVSEEKLYDYYGRPYYWK
jgi:hypothetical protein